MSIVVGRVVFDFSGRHFMQSFEGEFELLDDDLKESFDLIKSQKCETGVLAETIAGALIRCQVEDGRCQKIQFLCKGIAIPHRDRMEQQSLTVVAGGEN